MTVGQCGTKQETRRLGKTQVHAHNIEREPTIVHHNFTMVSPLSARLIAGYGSDKSLSDESKKSLKIASSPDGNSPPNPAPDKSTGSSGYAADMDTSGKPAFPPCMIGMTSRKSKREAVNHEKAAKRQKKAEQNYAATTVKTDLEKGGKPVPELRTEYPRTLPSLSGVEMSHVDHVFSKDFEQVGGQANVYEDYYFSAARLAEACRSFYNIVPQENKKEASEDENGMNSPSENGSTTSSVTNESSEGRQSSSSQKSQPSLIAMGDSLSITLLPLGSKGERSKGSEARYVQIHTITVKESFVSNIYFNRLVVLAFPPFTVIHASPVYATMSGRASKSILGKPLRDMFLAKEFSSAMASVDDGDDKMTALFDLNGRVLRTKSVENSKLCCQIKVSKLSTEYYAVAG